MNILEHKYQYYREWFLSMNLAERQTEVGTWVFERIAMFSELIRQQEADVKRFKRNVAL